MSLYAPCVVDHASETDRYQLHAAAVSVCNLSLYLCLYLLDFYGVHI